MDTKAITPERLAASPIAVPPLARNADLSLNLSENVRQIRHLEAGGVDILLYGGNANFHHLSIHEYKTILEFLANSAGDGSLVVDAAYGDVAGEEFEATLPEFAVVVRRPH